MTAPFDIRCAEGVPAVRMIVPLRHRDTRGFFSETWRDDAFGNAGIKGPFVQENHALSRAAGTIRGLHFQIGATAQAKLTRCTRGSIFDVAVDIRHGSPTFGRHASAVLSGENGMQLYLPAGFAHGYATLEPDSEVIYKVTAYYDPAAERGLAFNDPEIAIAWPLDSQSAVLTERDRGFPRFHDLPAYFSYGDFPD